MDDIELDHFKKINLADYAASHGYVRDDQESSRNVAIMRKDSDKIAVSRNGEHYVYYSFRDERDNGTIVDFLQRRRNLSLGLVRRELRSFANLPTPSHIKTHLITPVEKNLRQVVQQYTRMMLADRHPYLESRGISPQVLQDSRFYSVIRIDHRGNAIFPHFREGAVVGYEIRNNSFKGFSTGGERGLWRSTNIQTAARIIFTESAIDALSHAQLHGILDDGYVSTGGVMSERQLNDIQRLIQFAEKKQIQLVSGFDNDKAGNEYAQKLTEMAGGVIAREIPVYGKDWNDQLQQAVPPSTKLGFDFSL